MLTRVSAVAPHCQGRGRIRILAKLRRMVTQSCQVCVRWEWVCGCECGCEGGSGVCVCVCVCVCMSLSLARAHARARNLSLSHTHKAAIFFKFFLLETEVEVAEEADEHYAGHGMAEVCALLYFYGCGCRVSWVWRCACMRISGCRKKK